MVSVPEICGQQNIRATARTDHKEYTPSPRIEIKIPDTLRESNPGSRARSAGRASCVHATATI